jgi:hypothetical protein
MRIFMGGFGLSGLLENRSVRLARSGADDKTSIRQAGLGRVRLPRKLHGSLRNNDAWEHSRRPNVDGLAKIDGFIQRAALDAQDIGSAATLVPESRSTGRTKCAVERVPRIGRARPEVWFTLQNMKRALRHNEGNAESRCGLFSALPAMANVEFKRRLQQLVADGAALAPSEANIAFV